MKKDKEQNQSGNMDLDNVPFPDQNREHHCCCHGEGGHSHGQEQGCCQGEGHEDGHECQCKDGDEAHDCQCKGEQGDVSELYAKLDAVATENAALREMLVRGAADFDNFRKRVIRDKEDARKMANADLVGALIPVLDTMILAQDSARQHHPEAAAVLDGVDMIINQFRNVLREQGVEEINPLGDVFDPNMHESIAHQPSADIEEGKVSFVVRTGYRLNGRLLRPASVILSSGPAA